MQKSLFFSDTCVATVYHHDLCIMREPTSIRSFRCGEFQMQLMKMSLLVTLICCVSRYTNAQYDITLLAEIHSGRNYTDAQTRRIFFPFFNATEQAISTNAQITVTSPSGLFHATGFGSGGGLPRTTTSQIVNEVNGTWGVTIIDDGNTFNYAVDISLNLPFEQLPELTSSRLINGSQVGGFDWSITGGLESAFPGPASLIEATLWSNAFEQPIDSDYLPIDDGYWNPTISVPEPASYIGSIATYLETKDFDAIQILDVRPLTIGSPTLTLSSPSVRYTSSISATLLPGGFTLLGDYDRDGRVDESDFALWKNEFGSITSLDADGNGNGVIDAGDYTIWRDNFGAGTGTGALAVPEPAGVVVICSALLGILAICRRPS
jgi:hypothetical protein